MPNKTAGPKVLHALHKNTLFNRFTILEATSASIVGIVIFS